MAEAEKVEEAKDESGNPVEEAVGIVVDHIMTTKKMMEQGSTQAYQSIVPLKGGEHPLPDHFIERLYEVLQKEPKPYLEQDFPYYYKSEEGEMIEGIQTDRRYRTKLDHVNIMEAMNKSHDKVLEVHVVIGPIGK